MTRQEQIAKIEEWKQIIVNAEEEVSFLNGRLSSKQEEMKLKYDVNTIPAAQKLYESLLVDIEKASVLVTTRMEEIQHELEA